MELNDAIDLLADQIDALGDNDPKEELEESKELHAWLDELRIRRETDTARYQMLEDAVKTRKIMTVVAVVSVIAAGVFCGLWLSARQDYEQQKANYLYAAYGVNENLHECPSCGSDDIRIGKYSVKCNDCWFDTGTCKNAKLAIEKWNAFEMKGVE